MSYTIDSCAVRACVLACPSWVRRKPKDLPLGVLIDEDLAQQLCDELWLECLRLTIDCCPSEKVSCVLENPELTCEGPKPPQAQASPRLLLLIWEMLCFSLRGKRARVPVELQ